jgi:hypothetical protein
VLKKSASLPGINQGEIVMFKKFTEKLFGKGSSTPQRDGFFLKVRCSECGEEFNLFINKQFELVQNFQEDGSVDYSLKKEIYGMGCRNHIHVTMEFNGNRELLSQKIENGEFIED